MSEASLWDKNAAELLSATTSEQPTPGGGSIAALSGAFGVGLLCMALGITRNRAQKNGLTAAPELSTSLGHLQDIQARLKHLTDEDAAVFGQYMTALKRPKANAEEKAARAKALAAAGEAARATPFEVARLGVAALAEAQAVAAQIHREVVSDVGASAALLRGAVDAALLTADINLVGLSNEQKAPLLAERQRLAAQAQEQTEAVLAQVQRQIYGLE